MAFDVKTQVPTESPLLDGKDRFVVCKIGGSSGMIPINRIVVLAQEATVAHLPATSMIKGNRGDFKKAAEEYLDLGNHWISFLHGMKERFWSLDNPHGTYKMYLSPIIAGIEASLGRIRRNVLENLVADTARNWKSPALRRRTRVALEDEAKAVRGLTKDYRFKEDGSIPDDTIIIDLGLNR